MYNLLSALMYDKVPSNYIRRYFNLYPEIWKLRGIPQSPIHHPEGDVFEHTMLVLDEAATRRDDAVFPVAFMISALTHDFGKSDTTEFSMKKGDWTAYDHDVVGVESASSFAKKIMCNDAMTSSYVANMVELHMKPVMYARNGAKEKKWMKLFSNSVCPKDLLLLCECDFKGRALNRNFEPIKAHLESMLNVWIESKTIK